MDKRLRVVHPKDDFRVVVRDVLRIGDDLNIEFRRQSLLYGRVSWFSAQAKRRVRDVKNELEVVSARLRRIISKKGHHTKDEMTAALIRKEEYREKQRELSEAVYQEDVIQGMVRALEHKKDALVGLGANYRHSMPDELRGLSKELQRRRKQRAE